jgi:hypothetical protein
VKCITKITISCNNLIAINNVNLRNNIITNKNVNVAVKIELRNTLRVELPAKQWFCYAIFNSVHIQTIEISWVDFPHKASTCDVMNCLQPPHL